MKMKKIIALLLAVMMIVCMSPLSVFAAKTSSADDFVLYVNPYGNSQDSPDTIKWYKQGLEYYLFLPADCDESHLTVYFTSKNKVKVNGKVIYSGKETNAFSSRLGKVSLQNGLKPYIVNIVKSESIPALYIQTEESMEYINADKENKSKGSVMTYEGGTLTLNSDLKQIKGRGNSTWNYDKKGYNIKFDKKTSFLGMPKAKKWSLVACYIDPAMDKNPLGWELAEQIGLSFTPEYSFADLYINGEYYGTYLVCESVEIGENRVNITDLTKATEKANEGYELDSFSIGGSGSNGLPEPCTIFPNAKWVNIPNNPKDITGGYLLECEYISRIDNEISTFATTRGQSIVVKEPEYASEAQVKYISNYWQEAEDAICAENGYNSLGKHYSEYFDVDSLVNMYILLEFSGNSDAGISSTFFYKDQGGKLVATSLWDNDTAFGSIGLRGTTLSTDPSVWVVNRMNQNYAKTMPTNDEYPTIYNMLYRNEEFRTLVSERWEELSGVFNKENIESILDGIDDTVKASCKMNGIRWYSLLSSIAYDGSTTLTKSYVNSRIDYLNKGFGRNAAQLYYDPNGGTGWSIENKIMVNGDTAIVNGPYSTNNKTLSNADSLSEALGTDIVPPSENLEFAGWNTKADGSGTTYLPGSTIKLKGTIILYAQWKEKENLSVNYDYAKTFDNPVVSIGESANNSLKSLAKYVTNKFKKVK